VKSATFELCNAVANSLMESRTTFGQYIVYFAGDAVWKSNLRRHHALCASSPWRDIYWS